MSDLSRMQPKQLSAFLAQSELDEWQKDEVLASADKTAKYNDILYWHRLSSAMNARRDADVALSRDGIFIQDRIKEKLQSVLDLVSAALTEDQMNHQHPPLQYSDRLHNHIDRVRTDGKQWMEEAESMIKARLWDHG